MPKIKCDCKNPKLISCPKCRKPEKITDKDHFEEMCRKLTKENHRARWWHFVPFIGLGAAIVENIAFEKSMQTMRIFRTAIKSERDSRKGKG